MRSSGEILKIVQDEPLINPDVGGYINNPELVNKRLGPAFQYAQPVEAEVPESARVARILLPNMDEELAEFFDIWEPQEARHGDAQLQTLQELKLAPGAQVKKNTLAVEIGGRLAKVSAGLHDVAEAIVILYAGLGEKETQIAYSKMGHKLLELGEVDLTNGLMSPMTHQESLHLGYYRTAFLERRQRMRPWQLNLVRRIVEAVYLPVGVQRNNIERMRGFGEMTLLVSEDPYESAIETQELAASLLEGVTSGNPFVVKRYQQCIDEFKEAA